MLSFLKKKKKNDFWNSKSTLKIVCRIYFSISNNVYGFNNEVFLMDFNCLKTEEKSRDSGQKSDKNFKHESRYILVKLQILRKLRYNIILISLVKYTAEYGKLN